MLRFSIDEWEALPWWQKQVYIEGLMDEADTAERESTGQTAPQQPTSSGGMGLLDSLYNGSVEDVHAALK